MNSLRAVTLAAALATALGVMGCATSHAARGLVLSVEPDSRRVTVSHEAIPGFMDAMVMPFTARTRDELAEVQPGDRIAFRIKTSGGETLIDRVQLLSAARVDPGALASPPKPVLVPIGAPVPDFTLVDQHAGEVSLSSLRGKVVAVTFIYTRCPLPDYCPRMMANLLELKSRFQRAARQGSRPADRLVRSEVRHARTASHLCGELSGRRSGLALPDRIERADRARVRGLRGRVLPRRRLDHAHAADGDRGSGRQAGRGGGREGLHAAAVGRPGRTSAAMRSRSRASAADRDPPCPRLAWPWPSSPLLPRRD